VLNQINGQSISQNIEYGGLIYEYPAHSGNFYHTAPVPGELDNVDVYSERSFNQLPKGAGTLGYYHTHGRYTPGYANEKFSDADKSACRGNGVGYLATPSGYIKKWDAKKPPGERESILQRPSPPAAKATKGPNLPPAAQQQLNRIGNALRSLK
jgi:hypothetical protein